MGMSSFSQPTLFGVFSTHRSQFGLAVFSGLLMTAAFPKIGASQLAWISLAPLLMAIRDLSPRRSFQVGWTAGLAHFLSLLYWLVPTMHIYGYLPLYQCLVVLFAMVAYLSIFIGLFCFLTSRWCFEPKQLLLVPVLWVGQEYLRSTLLSGFPWELLGYSQYHFLKLIQVADLVGVYGVSFLIVVVNVTVLMALLAWLKWKWQATRVDFFPLAVCMALCLSLVCGSWLYSDQRIRTVDRQITHAVKEPITVVQGNIDQSVKWDPAFQVATIYKYRDLSLSARGQRPALIVWPETATPFYFLYDSRLSKMVLESTLEET